MRLLIILFFFTLQSIAQKKVIYTSFADNEINKEQFDSIYKLRFKDKGPNFYITELETDTTITYHLNSCLVLKKIKQDEMGLLVDYLKKITGEEVDKNKKIVIEYFPTKGSCVGSLYYNLDFKEKIKRRKDSNPLIYLVESNHPKTYDSSLVKSDDEDFFKKYFKVDLGCLNYFYLKPNGDCYILLGEHHYNRILDKIVKD